MSTLAQQLNKLKIVQKDEIDLPQRTRISFLFDIKQAANVDDQTLYYICLSGLREIATQLPELASQLQPYQSDILSEKSLEFYRGTMTKDTIKHVDDQLTLLIKLLAPYFLNQSTHKVIEYLIRIYEIHAYHKHIIAQSFLPYFETAFFLRMMQLLNIKDDELFYFIEPFAYTGQSLDMKSLIKGLSRNNATLFSKYAEYCFGLCKLHEGLSQDINNCLHWKFFGAMLFEILKLKEEDQTLLFNVLPFISQGMKSSVKDLRIASLLGISQIACRKSLTKEYSHAFFKQVLLFISKDARSDDEILNALVVLVLLCQFQRISTIISKDISIISEIENLGQLIDSISQSHDVSSLIVLIVNSILHDQSISVEAITPFFQHALNLKIAYQAIENVVSTAISQPEDKVLSERAHLILAHLKKSNEPHFNQAVLFLLKQVKGNDEQRDHIVSLLQGSSKGSQLIQKFGDKEYSLLSSIASESKITKLNAIQSLLKNEFSQKLSQNEKDLIKISLSQLIIRNTEEEAILQKTLEAFITLVDMNKTSDADFDVLEQFIESNINHQRYSQQIINQAIQVACKLRVSHADGRSDMQLMLAFSFDQIHYFPAEYGSFKSPSSTTFKSADFIKLLTKDFKKSQSFILKNLSIRKNWQNYAHILDLITVVIDQFNAHPSDINNLYIEIVNALRQGNQVEITSKILHLLISKLKKSTDSQTKLLRKLIGLSLEEKQRNKEFNVPSLIHKIYTEIFGSSQQKLAEFLVQTAVESKNELKQVFAIISLEQLARNVSLNPQIMMILAVTLSQSSSKVVRSHAMNLVEIFSQVKDDTKELTIFTETPKPKSTKKALDKQEFTPLKLKPIQKLFISLLQMRDEIVSDGRQVAVALNQSAHVGHIDHTVRLLLDLPSMRMKTEFVKSLLVLNKYSIVLAMTLQEQLNKEYFSIKLGPLTKEHNNYLVSVGQLITKIASQKSTEAQEEFISSLIFSYLQFVLNLSMTQKIEVSLEQQVEHAFKQTLFKSEVLRILKVDNTIQALRLYVLSQIHLVSKVHRQSIRQALVQAANSEGDSLTNEILTEKEVAPLLNDAKEKIIKSSDDKSILNLEVILETLTQIRVQNEVNLLPSILDMINILSKRTQNDGTFYLIELCVQLSIQIIQSKNRVKSNAPQTLQLISEILNQQFHVMKELVEETLSSKSTDTSDPFQQFMMEVDQGASTQVKSVEQENEKLITVFQIVSSVSNLLLQFETNLVSSSTETQIFLGNFAKLITGTVADERSSSVKGQNIVIQLFRFYQTQVLKAVQSSTRKNIDIKEMLATFIDTLLVMDKQHVVIDQLYTNLRQIVADTTYVAFAIFVLLSHGKDSVQVQDDLQLDSTEIKLSSRLLIDSKNVLSLFEELVFYITSIQFSTASDSFVKQRLSLMFDSDTVTARSNLTAWVYARYIKSDKDSRKFKYLTVYLLNIWISQSESIQKQMAYQSKEHAVTSNTLFYQVYLSSSVFNETVSQALQSKDFGDDKKVKKSLKRLHQRIQDFQRNLNTLLSYDVQVSIVNKVLTEFNDVKQTINLRTITLQLLLNKTPQFATTLSKVQEKEMIATFNPLIKNVIGILSSIGVSAGQKLNSDKQNFIMALFSLLQRVVSNQLSVEIKEQILQLVLSFNDHAHSFSLMVHSQLILTSMTLFEAHHLDILEHLQRYFDQLSASFSRVSESSDFFSESFTKTLLKACLSVSTFFSKFLNATQYEAIIKNTLVISDKQFADDVKAILDVISKEATKHVGFKLIFQAMINSYDDVIVTKVTSHVADVSTIIIRYFNDLVKQVIMRVKKEFIVENHKRIFDFFKHAFTLPYTFSKSGSDMLNVQEVEQAVANSFEQFVIKMSEEQLRPLIVKQTKQAFKAQDTQVFPYNMHKVIMFLRTMNTLLQGMREFFVPLLPLYFEKVLSCLTVLGQRNDTLKRKKMGGQLEFNQDDSTNHTIYELLLLVLENIRLNFSYDNLSFIQNDTVEKISEPLSALVTLSVLESKYTVFIESYLKPTVFEVVERINNDDMWKKINYDILMHTRNAHSNVRHGAFKIIEHLFSRIGERYLILLNDTIPFLSEGMEDENPDVEQCAKAIVARIEQMTGDSIHEYLK